MVLLFIVVVAATACEFTFVAYVGVLVRLFAGFVMVGVNSVVASISWLYMLSWFLGYAMSCLLVLVAC